MEEQIKSQCSWSREGNERKWARIGVVLLLQLLAQEAEPPSLKQKKVCGGEPGVMVL